MYYLKENQEEEKLYFRIVGQLGGTVSNNHGPTTWDIAIGVCTGILMAGAISGVFTALVMMAYLHGFRLELDKTISEMPATTKSFLPATLSQQPAPKVQVRVIQVVPSEGYCKSPGDTYLASTHECSFLTWR